MHDYCEQSDRQSYRAHGQKKTIVPACIDVFQVASQCCGVVHKVAAMVFGEAVGAVVGLLLFLELMFFLTLAFFAAVAV